MKVRTELVRQLQPSESEFCSFTPSSKDLISRALGRWGGVSMKTVAASITFRRSGRDQMSAKTCPPQVFPLSLAFLIPQGRGQLSLLTSVHYSKNTGVGSLSLLQRIFPTEQSNQGLPHYRRMFYQLSHQGSPFKKLLLLLSCFSRVQLCATP